MAFEPIAGLKQVDAYERDGTDLFTGSDPVVVRVYSGPDMEAVQEAFEDTLVKAEEEGWEIDWIDFGRDGFSANRDIDSYPSSLSVSILSPSAYNPTPELFVELSTARG